MSERDDPLWNPEASPDAELARMQRLLAPYGARARGLQVPSLSPRRRLGARAAPWALAAALVVLLVDAGSRYRLTWTPGNSWTAVRHQQHNDEARTELRPGQALVTAPDESATIAVARIGRIALAPGSRLRLVQTGTGRHRVALEYGHMRARIWAPPGYFGVRAASGEVVDLGCDFDLWKRPDGSGRVFVRSGWVSYRVGDEDVLVPEHFGLSFNGAHAHTPLRPDAPVALARAVDALESVIARDGAGSKSAQRAATRVAASARDRDAFSMLSLLSRWPALASTPLYPRLGAALGVRAIEPGHRQAWEAGDQNAIDAWWQKIPSQPKRWWTHWNDVLG
jgi:hypothetical protein